MKDKLDIYKLKSKLGKAVKSLNNLSPKNKELLLKFHNECFTNGLSNARTMFYLAKLIFLAKKYKKDFDKLTTEDIKGIITDIEKSERYTEWSKAGYKLTIKKFYKWLDKGWNSKEFPERVAWIRASARKSKLEDPIVLTKEEVIKLFNAADGIREKALVSFMYESGCRCPDELLNMKVSDIEFDDFGAKVKLHSGKVGSRIIRVISCIPHLKAWLETEHPNPKHDSYLWTRKGSNKVLGYASLKKMIAKWRSKAGIEKRITAYTFRRTRYTHLSTKIPTPALYNYMGQVQGSDVIGRYVKLSGDDTEEAILNFYGITNPKNSDIKPLFCSRCGKQNAPELQYCSICNAPLTEKARLTIEDKYMKDNEDLVERLIAKKMEELKTKK